MSVTIAGPLQDASGYAYHTRSFALELQRCGLHVRLEPVPWGAAQIVIDPETMWRLRSMMRMPPGDGPLLMITVANAFRTEPGRPCIGWTMLETDRISDFWVRQCNAMDEIWVPTQFNRETFTNSGVDPGKIHVVPLGTDLKRFRAGLQPLRVPGKKGFAFLANGEWIPRKGFDILVRAYAQEFAGIEDVTLILKAYDNSAYDPDGKAIRQQVYRILSEVGNPRPPHIVFLTQVLRPEEVPSLYAAADCYVLPTRGEGWNHPAVEASACGVPVITTNWSGHLEFLNEANSYLIPVERLEPVPPYGVPNDQVYAGSNWAVPSLEATRWLMRHVFSHREQARARAKSAREAVQALTWENSARVALERLRHWGA